MLAELNGDALWSNVLKQRQEIDRRRVPNQKRGKENQPRLSEDPRENTVWDVRRLIKFTNEQLEFLKT